MHWTYDYVYELIASKINVNDHLIVERDKKETPLLIEFYFPNMPYQ